MFEAANYYGNNHIFPLVFFPSGSTETDLTCLNVFIALKQLNDFYFDGHTMVFD